LFDRFRGPHSTLLIFGKPSAVPPDVVRLAGNAVRTVVVMTAGFGAVSLPPEAVLVDGDDEAHRLYFARPGTAYLVRPDGHIGFRGPATAADALLAHLRAVLPTPA
jgi:hypothetical protein